MQAIHIVLDDSLLKLADRAARRAKVNRSALFREALREHLRRLETLEKERRDRLGYERAPATEFGVCARRWRERSVATADRGSGSRHTGARQGSGG